MRTQPLRRLERADPFPGPDDVRIRVAVCGVCRTDLHLAEGDLPPHLPHAVPGHEIVGYVDALGERAQRFSVGDRVGAAWLAATCGACAFCREGRENLCLRPRFTGWDVDGGYAQFVVADERFVYPLPSEFSDETAAPLLCAGIIGYRALRRTDVELRGARLGIWGFGASAHLTAQLAIALGATVHVITRSPEACELAMALGAASAATSGQPPERLDAGIVFAPSGAVVPGALESLDRGGTLSIAGIYLSEIPPLDYERHLFYERSLRSVTANTRRDGEEFLALAAEHRLHVEVTRYPMAQADVALSDLAADRVRGAAVLVA